MEQKTISKEWLQIRSAEIQKQREENSKYVTLKQGENIIKIDLSVLPINDPNGKYGAKQIWTTATQKADKNGVMRNLLLSASPTLDALIIKALCAGMNPFTLIKVGDGKETRYAIKELEK